jgi:hypothetical protein
MKTIPLSALAAGLAIVLGGIADGSLTAKLHHGLSTPEIVSVPSIPGLTARLRGKGLDLLAEWEGKIYIVATAGDMASLRALGIPFALETGRLPLGSPDVPWTQGGPNGAYHSYGELRSDLLDLQQRYPSLAKVYDLGESLEGRRLYALKISDNVGLDEDEAEVLFLGCHHAREWISVEVPYRTGKYLLQNYAADPEIRRLVDAGEVWIVPLVNPDGLEYSIRTYRYWRKNRRFNADGSFGVDLNRNYGQAWGLDDEGSSPDPADEVYRGTGPFSEPETKAVRDLVLRKDFRAVVSFHSYGQVILYPWSYTQKPAPEKALLAGIAERMAGLMESVYGRPYETGQSGDALYLSNGDAMDWMLAVSGAPSFTIELPPVDEIHGGFINAEADIDSVFGENLPAMIDLIDGAVRDYRPAAGEAERGRKRESPLRPVR